MTVIAHLLAAICFMWSAANFVRALLGMGRFSEAYTIGWMIACGLMLIAGGMP